MREIQILDCTLRDGGYLLDKTFGDDNIRGIIGGLEAAKIDIIEIGFLQNEGFGEGRTVFLNSKSAEKYIPAHDQDTFFAAFADCSRYNVDNLEKCSGRSFTAVRECFYKWEQDRAIDNCKRIIEKGYLCFVQPVDILGYTDVELLQLIQKVNLLDIYCFSIVDTFGSMYEEDLSRLFSLIHHNLKKDCRIGFHSHNNLQMSSALSQNFIQLASGKRKIVVDSTISGMGRGAGNTPTELIVQYLVDKRRAVYDIDALLDVIDNYMRNIRTMAEWGYNTEFYLAGAYTSHVNNLAYLLKKNSLSAKDIRYILNQVEPDKRKRYDYDLLDEIYCNYIRTDIDDRKTMDRLAEIVNGRNILVIAAGNSIVREKNKIFSYIRDKNALVITINRKYPDFSSDFIYVSNVKRYKAYRMTFADVPCIITSNIKTKPESEKEYIVSLHRLLKCGWKNMDNSLILLLRLLKNFPVMEIGIAGFDGYDTGANYADRFMELYIDAGEVRDINQELADMFEDFRREVEGKISICFVTASRFDHKEREV